MHSRTPPVLVVDGDNQRLSETRGWLSQEGFQLLDSASASETLHILDTLQPILLVLGHKLSDGEGIRLCANLKADQKTAHIPILMLGPQKSRWIEDAFAAGADDVCTFPTHEAVLRRRIRLLIDIEDQRQKATKSKRRAHQLFHNNRAVMLLVNPNSGQIVDANRAACAYYGYSRQQLLSMSLLDLDAPAMPKSEITETTNITFRQRLANGEYRDVVAYNGPVETGARKYICMIIHDVTKRKLAQVAEIHQRAMASALREIAADIVKTLDHDEVLDRIFANMQHIIAFQGASVMLVDGKLTWTRRLKGYDDHDFDMSTIEDIRWPIDATHTLRTVIETGVPIIISDVQLDPNWITVPGLEWVRSHITAPIRLGTRTIGFLNVDSPTPDAYSEADAERLQAFADQAAIAINNADLYSRLNDQAERLEAHVAERTEELEHERAQLNAILDSMTEGVVYAEPVDGKMHVRFVNAALITLTGYEEGEWLGASPAIFAQSNPDGQPLATVARTIIERLVAQPRWQVETRVVRKDKSSFLANISAARLVDPEGKLVGVVGVVHDISKEKALAEQRSRFVAHASHELRTPLTNAKTRLYLLKKQPERMADHLGVLEAVVDNMRELVEDMLDLSRLERNLMTLKTETTDLVPFVRELVELQRVEAEGKMLTLCYETATEPVLALVDTKRLARVITNLLVNAINYTPEGGTITARLLSGIHDPVIGTCAKIEIEDNGIGIAEDNLENVFQPFFRVPSEVQGTGLGLSIAREIVQIHGGDIHISSALGLGSSFAIVLPQLVPETPKLTEAEA
ncbi:MAG: PAS domain S-box protein [Anaerolineae bacterium]|nr:PAS domain S-box protein [Anaerolineae bacterium]